jgi:hypothetical protein
MRHTTSWAVLAHYPLLVAVVGAFAPESANLAALGAGREVEFLDAHWWVLLGGPAVVALLFFVAHALFSRKRLGVRRFAWAAGMLLLTPVLVPAYWWFCSDAS